MNPTRRQFLQSGLLTGSWLLLPEAIKSATRSPIPSTNTSLTPNAPARVLADLHVHAMLNEWNSLSPIAQRNPLLADSIKKMVNKTKVDWKRSYDARIDLMCVAHFNMFDEWITMPTDPSTEAPAHTIRMINQLEKKLEEQEVQSLAKLAKNAFDLKALTDIPKDSDKFRIAVVHTVEGAHALGGDLGAIDKFANRGVAAMTVTHFFNKGVGSSGNSYPFFPDANSRWPNQGLSEFGQCVLKRMQEKGMIIDISHATAATVADILEEVSCPVIASHSSVRTLGDHPYSLEDEHIQHVARKGGMIGIILMPYWLSNYTTDYAAAEKGGLDEVIRTITYVAKIAGTRCIGIGSDFAGYITGPNDLSDLSHIGKLRNKLISEFDEETANQIMGQNVIEFFVSNWKGNSH